MANMYPVNGQRIFIGGILADKNADFVEADFAGQSWVEIDGWTQMGRIGDASATITSPVINRGRDVKAKGSKNAGSMQNAFNIVPGDPGQTAMIAAQGSNENYAFRIDGNEKNASQVSRRYFIGLVMGAEDSGGGANVFQGLSSTVEVNSNIVRVPAVP